MKFPFLIISLLVFFMNPAPISAHFFPNITSIPASLIPNATGWEAFNKLLGCRHGMKVDGLAKLKKYFQYFGYLNSAYADFSDEFDDPFESAVKIYQLNFNLDTTGVIDAPTLKHIVQPRCGNPDVVNGTSTMRFGKPSSTNSTIHTVAHYSFFPNRPRWPASKSQLTYAFLPENQVPMTVQNLFSRSFDRWSEVTTLTFTQITSFRQADIKIGFFSGDHGDGEPFDGVLGTLAHAFAPTVGRMHLDNDENWVINGDFINAAPISAVDLESVAVHEIGHLLGLGHSSVQDAIMYPTIPSGVRRVELANDDITGIQVLYGANPNFNGSGPILVPRQERDSSSGHSLSGRWVLLFIVGLFFLLFV
ncbi:metalloendoproteinase 2-MMP-like [Primulina huaijiensis]|uniref:metalloendoproteinase 2-MMP-like n=1 Tax=Primulina huaijiensis TaxID=1492673 RepID=UPI003CC72219